MTARVSLRSKRKKFNIIKIKKEKMIKYLIKGLKVNEAALLSGVSKTELTEMRCDPNFEDIVTRSQAILESEHLENISDAGSMGAWQASAWMLERLFPEKYGKKDTIEHKYEVKLMSFQQIVLEVINDCSPQLKQVILQRLRKADLENIPSMEQQKTIEHKPLGKVIDI